MKLNLTVRRTAVAALAVPLLALTACGDDDSASGDSGDGGGQSSSGSSSAGGESTADAEYPNVLKAELSGDSEDGYSLSVTMSSEYDTPERYADGWRVLDADGNELGTNELGHDHASEQPFTRSQSGLEIPDGVEQVTIEGRDLENGYGGETVTVDVP